MVLPQRSIVAVPRPVNRRSFPTIITSLLYLRCASSFHSLVNLQLSVKLSFYNRSSCFTFDIHAVFPVLMQPDNRLPSPIATTAEPPPLLVRPSYCFGKAGPCSVLLEMVNNALRISPFGSRYFRALPVVDERILKVRNKEKQPLL